MSARFVVAALVAAAIATVLTVGLADSLAARYELVGRTGDANVGYVSRASVSVAHLIAMTIASIFNAACVTAMAAKRRDILAPLSAFLALAIVGACASILAPLTFDLSIVLFVAATAFVLPSVLVGRCGAADAIGESLRLSSANRFAEQSRILPFAIVYLAAAALGAPGPGGYAVFFIWSLAWQVLVSFGALFLVNEYMKLQALREVS